MNTTLLVILSDGSNVRQIGADKAAYYSCRGQAEEYNGYEMPLKDVTDFCNMLCIKYDIMIVGSQDTDNALRYNEGKLDWTLVDFELLEPLVQVLDFGQKKYSRENWKKSMPKMQILASLIRHVFKLLSGEELDRESGLPHIGHIMANAMFYSYHSKK